MATTRSIAVIGILCIQWLFCWLGADALIIVAQANLAVPGGGTVTNNHLVTFQCASTDLLQDAVFNLQITAQDGSTQPVQITCNHIEYDFNPLLWGYTPASIDYEASDMQAAFNPLAFNATQNVNPTLRQASGRQLLWHQLQEQSFRNGERIKDTRRELNSFFDGLLTGLQKFTCAGGLATFSGGGAINVGAAVGGLVAVAGGCDQGSEGGISQGQLDQLQTDATDAQAALANLQSAQIQFSTQLVAQQQLDQDRFVAQQQYNTANDQRAAATQAEVTATSDAVNLMAEKLTQRDQQFANQFISLSQTQSGFASELQLIANQGNDNFQKIVAAESLNDAMMNQQLNNLTGLITFKFQRAMAMIRELTQNLGDTQASLERFYRDETFVQGHTANLQTKITGEWIPQNLLNVFAIELGQAPASNLFDLGTQSTIELSRKIMQYIRIDPNDNLPWATQTTFEYRCSSVWLALKNRPSVSWQTLSEWIGPSGCSIAESPNMCRCWVEVISEITCIMPQSSPGVVATAAFNSFETSDVFVGAQHCQGGGNPTPNFFHAADSLQGTIATNLTQYLSIEATIGLRGLYSNSGAGQFANYLEADVATGQEARYPIVSANITGGEWLNLMNPTVQDYNNPVYFWFINLQAAYQLLSIALQPVMNLVYGIPPDPATQEAGTYRAMQFGATGRWSRWALTAHDKNFIAVTVPQQTSTAASPTVLLNGSPVQPSSVVVNNPDIALLPIGITQLGDPFSTTTAYNPRPEDMPINMIARGRCGAITYNICGCQLDTGGFGGFAINPTDCPDHALDVWESTFGDRYDHNCGAASASNYLTPIDSNPSSPTYGLCTGSTFVLDEGNWCALRNAYAVNSNRGQNLVAYIPRNANYEFTVTVPEGIIELLALSQCPSAVPTVPIPGYVGITIQNVATSTNVLFLSEGPGCPIPPNLVQISIPSLSTLQIKIPQCQRTPAGQTEQVTFSYQSGNTLIPCPTKANVTVDQQSDVELFQSPMLENIRTSGVDGAYLILMQARLENYMINLQTQSSVLNGLITSGVQLSQPVLDNFTAIQLGNQALIEQTTANLEAARNLTVFNYTDFLVPYDDTMVTLKQQFNNANSQALQTNANLAVLNQQGAIGMLALNASLARLAAAFSNFTNAFDRLINDIVADINTLNNNAGGSGGWNFSILNTILIIFAIAIVIGVLVCVLQNCVLPLLTKPPPTKGRWQKDLGISKLPPELKQAIAQAIAQYYTAQTAGARRHSHSGSGGSDDDASGELLGSGSRPNHPAVAVAHSEQTVLSFETSNENDPQLELTDTHDGHTA